MTHNTLEYPLVNGFIHNWLLAGPQVLAKRPDEPLLPLDTIPVERDEITTVDGTEKWAYYRCLDDHLVDLSAVHTPGKYARAWVYVKLNTPAVELANIKVFASGPVEVLLNEQLVFQTSNEKPDKSISQLIPHSIQASLQEENELFIRFAAFTEAATQHTLAVKLEDFTDEESSGRVTVQVPTRTMFPHRHKIFESLFDYAYLEDFVHHKGNLINIRWADEAERSISYSYKVRDALKQIYVDGNAEVKDEAYDAGHPQRLWERSLFIALQAPGREYWDQDLRYERSLPLQVLDNEYVSSLKTSSYGYRRKLALEHASRREPDLFAEIAKMVLEQWDKVRPEHILQSVDRVNAGEADALKLSVGLLGMLSRFQEQPEFPKEVLKPIENAVLGYAYPWINDEVDSHTQDGDWAVLAFTAAILAGQRMPKRNFNAVNLKGNGLRQVAESKAQTWLRQRGLHGFANWHADSELEGLILALTHLVSLAEDQVVRELAAVLLDKILFLLAVNNHKGVYGSAHSSVSAAAVKSGQLLAGTAISRLLYGLGINNPYLAAPVSLACSDYEFPSFFADIAANPPNELLHKERQVGVDGSESNLVSYRTPDYLLSSIQDYRPGQAGSSEQVWQATLGPDAVVFTNHPSGMGEQEGLLPGFWLGNAVLPRVAQWKENLVAVYNLPQDAWMGYTHAHFPVNAFDETVFARGWAFGRVGDGFIGLTCSAGFEQVKHGVGAFRELRSYGSQNVWLCILGRIADYGGFRKFQKQCMAIQPEWQALSVAYTSPKGDEIAFGWQGSLVVNGEDQPLSGFKHIENPYCTADLGSEQMDIQYGEILMRLNFN